MKRFNLGAVIFLSAAILILPALIINNSYAGEKLDNYILDRIHTLAGEGSAAPFSALASSDTVRRKKCGTPIMREVMKSLPDLTPVARAEVEKYLIGESPVSANRSERKGYKKINNDFNLTNTFASDNFVIIWGDDEYNQNFGTGIPQDDNDSNGVPDFVEKLSSYFETTWSKEIDEMGLKTPKKASDKLIDVYIANTAGSVKPNKLQLDSSFFAYTNTYSNNMPYIVINNVMPDTDNDDPDGNETGSQKVTAAHEFSHAVQFAYDRNESVWWQEASAVWMEDEVFDDVNDYVFTYLVTDTLPVNQYSPWTAIPEVHLTKTDGYHEYGAVVFAKYLSENYTASSMFKDVWVLCKKKSATSALNKYLKNNGSSLKSGFIDFAVKNVDLAANYEEGSRWQTVSKIKTISFTEAGTIKKEIKSSSSLPHAPAYLGSNYVEITGTVTGTLKVTFNGEKKYKGKKVKWKVKAVKSTGSGTSETESFSLNSSNKGTITISGFGTTYDKVNVVVAVVNKGKKNYKNGVPYTVKAVLQ